MNNDIQLIKEFEADLILMGVHSHKTLDSFRMSNGAKYNNTVLNLMFDGYKLRVSAEEKRMQMHTTESQYIPCVKLEHVDSIVCLKDSDDIVSAPRYFKLAYALVNSCMWPTDVAADLLDINYTKADGSGAQYVDILLLQKRKGEVASKDDTAAWNTIKRISDYFTVKTQLEFCYENRTHYLVRVMITHEAFLEMQG